MKNQSVAAVVIKVGSRVSPSRQGFSLYDFDSYTCCNIETIKVLFLNVFT